MRVAQEIGLTTTEHSTLQRWSQGRRASVRQSERARIILHAADGLTNKEIAMEMGVKAHTVGRWRSRFAESRLGGIEKDLPRGGRPRDQRERLESEIIRKTTQETPKNATHWSTRTLAHELGVTQSMLHRVWKANGLKPHLVRTFKQTESGPSFRGEVDRCGRSVSQSSGKGAGDQRRREKSDSSP